MRHLALMLLLACSAPPADDDGDTSVADDASARAERLLRGDVADRLELVVVLAAPTAGVDVGAAMVDHLTGLVDKPGGIGLTERPIDQTLAVWTAADLDDLADAHGLVQGDDDAVIEVLVVPGLSDKGDDILGVAWGQRRITLFEGALTAACDQFADPRWSAMRRERVCAATWQAVTLHELGHTLGLVNSAIPMVAEHEDPDHPHHDPDPECVMYWQFDGPQVAQKAGSRIDDTPLSLCPASLDDLAAIRDR